MSVTPVPCASCEVRDERGVWDMHTIDDGRCSATCRWNGQRTSHRKRTADRNS